MLSTPTKNQKLFDYSKQQNSSSKLNAEVTAQGAIGSFFARSNSKANKLNLTGSKGAEEHLNFNT
jgi:hypothetical protein